MTNEEAILWVDKERRAMVINLAKQYSRYSPYGIDDYLQIAYGAAVEAAMVLRKNPSLNFGGVWTNCFREEVRRITPYTKEARQQKMDKKKAEALVKGEDASCFAKKVGRRYDTSESFPSNMRADVDMERFVSKGNGRSRKISVEKAYNKIRDNLTEKEQAVMELALGLTMDGSLTAIEISRKLGIPRQTVTSIRTKVIKRAAKNEWPQQTQKSNVVYLEGGSTEVDDNGIPVVHVEGPLKKIMARG